MLHEKRLLFILAAVQFCHIIDFMIIMPLGKTIMETFSISPGQFAWVVSAFAVAALTGNLISTAVIDRFDRRSALLFLFCGFTLGTMACAFAPSYILLLVFRSCTGIFGGTLGALVLAIVGDAIPFERRGRAMGVIMLAFSGASEVGVTGGLYFANLFTWQAPVYMLAVVVDDHDMGVTHVIRGDDHLNNAARQMGIYTAMGWDVPVWAHIPLIHGPDGKKLSKRHGALGAEEYQKMGFPAAGMRNYLARLGWSHGDDEFFTDAQARDWFDLDGIGKSPARFDLKKLENLSGQHIAQADDAALQQEINAYLAASGAAPLKQSQQDGLLAALPHVKERAKTFPELLDKAHFILTERPITPDEKASKALDLVSRGILTQLTPHLQTVTWSRDSLEAVLNDFAAAQDTKFGKLAGPLRAALAGRAVTPSVFDMMLVLGREETLARLEDAAA